MCIRDRFNDERLLPIWEKSVTTVANDRTIINLDDLILNAQSDVNKSGIFYLGYFQQDIGSAQAFDVYTNEWNQFNMVGYQSFESIRTGTLQFNRTLVYANFKTYGLNLEISTYKDYTNTVIRNASQFDYLLKLMAIVKAIEQIAYSPRQNGLKRLQDDQINNLLAQLEAAIPSHSGNNVMMNVAIPFRMGFRNQIENEVKRITRTFFPKNGIGVSIPPCAS